ncbi:hypothetical protein [Brevibacterium sp. FME37]|uniref:hypothetical protein n=1 Tax=Brevibacterium sp. FME37 TaxID=2742607 RepID=UPI001D028BAC|nr:hypothetical protein [Brevibacterium sp. FME37]
MPPNSTTSLDRSSPKTHAGKHGRLRAAGLIGSSIEWYDFFLYGTAAALVFPHVFFPDAEGINGVLLSFSTFATGFIARPIGGLLAGNYGESSAANPWSSSLCWEWRSSRSPSGVCPRPGASASSHRSCW